MKSSSRAAVALLALTLAAPRSARADDSEAFFAQGRTLRAEGKCAEAIVAFRHALDLKPQGLGSLRNVAECEEHIGRLASARTDWWNLRRAVLQASEAKYDGWEKDAEAAYQRLEGKVAHLTVRITGPSPERARVTLDGEPLDPRLVGVELERDVGSHTVEVSYGGAGPLTESRTLAAGVHEVVTLVIPEAEAAPGAPPPASESRPLRRPGQAALAVGGAGLVGALISLAVRQSALSAFGVCAGNNYMGCPNTTDLHNELSKGRTASTLIDVFAAFAVAGVGVGVPLVLVDARRSKAGRGAAVPAPASARAVFDFVPLAGGAAAHVGAQF